MPYFKGVARVELRVSQNPLSIIAEEMKF
jgi:hypothetical protein